MGVEQEQGHTESPGPREEHILKFIKSIDGGTTTVFAGRLDKIGLLSHLEEAGILPTEVHPNPHDPDLELASFVDWGEQHPEFVEANEEAAERRSELLKYLLVGAIIGRHYPDLFASGQRNQTE